jgi:hypothetical protein
MRYVASLGLACLLAGACLAEAAEELNSSNDDCQLCEQARNRLLAEQREAARLKSEKAEADRMQAELALRPPTPVPAVGPAVVPTTFAGAAQSWVGRDVRDMAKVWGTPSNFHRGSDPYLDPTVVLWIDSNVSERPRYQAPPPPSPTSYSTNCSGYGNTVNCNTYANNAYDPSAEAARRAGFNLGAAIAQSRQHKCNVAAVVDPDTYQVLRVDVDVKSAPQCDKRRSPGLLAAR